MRARTTIRGRHVAQCRRFALHSTHVRCEYVKFGHVGSSPRDLVSASIDRRPCGLLPCRLLGSNGSLAPLVVRGKIVEAADNVRGAWILSHGFLFG